MKARFTKAWDYCLDGVHPSRLEAGVEHDVDADCIACARATGILDEPSREDRKTAPEAKAHAAAPRNKERK